MATRSLRARSLLALAALSSIGCSLLVDTDPYLTVCARDQYAATPLDADEAPLCVELTRCAAHEYEAAPPTATADRVCVAASECGADQYEAAAPAGSSDRVCARRPVPSLAGLEISAGALEPPFSPERREYMVRVGLFQSTLSVTPTAYPPDAIVEVDGAGVASGSRSPAVPLSLDDNTLTVEVKAADGAAARTYTVHVERASDALHETYVKASNTGAGDGFGGSVALYGDTLAIGAWRESSHATGVDVDQGDDSAPESGAVYVFTRAGSTWTQQAFLKASNTGAGDHFGASVALYGDTLAVGARSEDGGAAGVDGDQGDDSAENSGAVYVFTRAGSTWTQQAYVKASNTRAHAMFGWSVALHGDTLAVGSRGESSGATGVDGDQADDSAYGAGAVYVFTRTGSTWTQQAYVKASNTREQAYFGGSVALHGDTLAVGSLGESSGATGVNGNQSSTGAPGSGAAYVFTRAGSTWAQQAYVKASNTREQAYFGGSVALHGDTLAVGSFGESGGATGVNGNQYITGAPGSGAVYVFTRAGSTWTQQAYVKASNSEAGDQFGARVALYENSLAVGANWEDGGASGLNGDWTDNSLEDSGAVYLFTRAGSAWAQDAYIKPLAPGDGDYFGDAIALHGDTLAVGAAYEDGDATGVDGDRANESAEDSGAAYIFR